MLCVKFDTRERGIGMLDMLIIKRQVYPTYPTVPPLWAPIYRST